MSIALKPGSGILYMKVGMHAQESLADIIQRKRLEIERAGFALWGYGGNTCHPVSMVQPFAREFERTNGRIYLCMQPMESKHSAPPLRATEFSINGIDWETIHKDVNCLGSRYALVIRDLHEEQFNLSLAKTKVAIGNSVGRPGNKYIAGRIDKACLEIVDSETAASEDHVVDIGLVAEIADPYAVFVRGSEESKS